MNNFKEALSKVPGFRSNTTWKKVISILYFMFSLVMLTVEIQAFICFLAIPFFIFYTKDSITSIRNRQPIKKDFLIASLAFVLMMGSVFTSSADTTGNDTPKKLASSEVKKEVKKNDTKKEVTTKVSPIPVVAKEVEKKEEVKEVVKEEPKETVPSNFTKATVTKHVDGDTVHATLENGQVLKIRMIGVDTPETVHPKKPVEYYGQEASNYTKEQVFNKTVYLEKDVSDTDRYGRSLRYIWLTPPNDPNNITKDEVKTKMFNALLLTNGFANVSTYPPDVKYQTYFSEFESEARNNNIGLWYVAKAPQEQAPQTNVNTAVSKPSPNPTPPPTPAPAEPQPAPQQNTGSGLVITMTGKKYHRANCRTVKQVKQQVTATEAQSMGYTACKVCNP